MPTKPIATFVRNGVTREAYTPGDAVTLRAEGWSEKTRPAARAKVKTTKSEPKPDPDPAATATTAADTKPEHKTAKAAKAKEAGK